MNSSKYIQETKIPNLHVLTNGTIPPNPSELISSNNMKNLIELLTNRRCKRKNFRSNFK